MALATVFRLETVSRLVTVLLSGAASVKRHL
jgi:hypothetical protein